MSEKKKIAAIVTEYRPRSHADVIVTKFLRLSTDDGLKAPRVEIASLYLDQIPENDIGVEIAQAYGVPVYDSINAAMCLGEGSLAVDGVRLSASTGTTRGTKEQHLYPRRYFMEQICGAMATAGRGVPVFNDKHLSHNWSDARGYIGPGSSMRLHGRLVAAGGLAFAVGRTSAG